MENHKDWRERLDQNEAPMDTEKFWDSLESKIPAAQANKKKRRFFFWLLVLLIGSGITAGSILLTKPEKEIKELAIKKTAEHEMAIKEENRNSLINLEKDKTEDQKELANAEILTPSNDSDTPLNTARPYQYSGNKASSSASNTAKISTKPDKNKLTEGKQASQEGESFLAEKSLSAITPVEEHTQNSQPGNQYKSMSSEITASRIYAESPDKLPTRATEISTDPNWNPGSMPDFDNIQKIKANKSGWQYWMDLSYGVGMAQHAFSTSGPIIQSYLDNRSKHESILESRLAVWENRLIHPSGLYVSTGLRYQSHITRFDWSKEENKLEWKLADGFVEDDQGNQIAVRDSAWQQYRELREIRQHNMISTLDIPLNIGYLMRRNRFSLEFAVGVTANIAQYSSGKQLNLEGQPVKWNDADELTFREYSTGWGASAMLRGTWYPTEFLGIFIQPSYHIDFSNRMNTVAGSSHKLDFIGVQAGVAFLMFGVGR